MSPRVDVIVPTHDHALLLPLAVASAQAQTVSGVRVVVIGDGVGDDTRDVMAGLLRDDSALVFVDRPKSGRTGERLRHEVLVATDAEHITYLSDDDLLFPDHIERMLALLERADVAMPPSTHLSRDGEVLTSPWSLEDEPGRSLALSGTSLFSLTGLAHTMGAYRRLPFGWRDTPPGFYTDQYMLMQFLAEDWCRFAVDDTVTAVHLADSLRRDMTPDERSSELREVDVWMRERDGWAEFRRHAQRHLRHQAAEGIVGLDIARQQVAEASRYAADLEITLQQTRAAVEEATLYAADLVRHLDDASQARDEAFRSLVEQRRRGDELEGLLAERSTQYATVMATRTIRLRDSLLRRRGVRALMRWQRGG
ncbi:MAG: glycosyltransferase family A protein [Ilumatobacteraceae bacterium]